jgi:hypothetical protein
MVFLDAVFTKCNFQYYSSAYDVLDLALGKKKFKLPVATHGYSAS